jgi:hypothetical protein
VSDRGPPYLCHVKCQVQSTDLQDLLHHQNLLPSSSFKPGVGQEEFEPCSMVIQ